MARKPKPKNDKSKTTRALLCELSQKQLLARGDELAKAEIELQNAESTKKAAAAEHRGIVKAIKERVHSLSAVVDSGKEERDVDCTVERLFSQNVIRVTRDDNGKVVEETAMGPDDRQTELDGLDPEDPADIAKRKGANGSPSEASP